MVLETDGKPLWDGKSEIYVRKAFPEEDAQHEASMTRAIREGEIDDEDDRWVLYLVPVFDPTDEEAWET